jgi:hypothetical protein
MEDEHPDRPIPVLGYQPPREREKARVPLGLSALIMVLSFMAMGLGLFVAFIAWAMFGVENQRNPIAVGISLFFFAAGFLGRWFAVHASRFRK